MHHAAPSRNRCPRSIAAHYHFLSFVEKTLASAGEDYDRRMRLKASDIDLDVVMEFVSAHLGVNTAELSGPSRRQQICQARALVSFIYFLKINVI